MLANTHPQKNTDTQPDIKLYDHKIQVILNDRKEGLFVCPACNNGVTKDLSHVACAQRVIQISCRCKCGHVYKVSVERRSIIREAVNFSGTCQYHTTMGELKIVLIKIHDISMSGIQFTVNTLPDLKVDDSIIVSFNLDDWDRSKVCETGIIRWIQENKVGLEFDSVERFGKLGLYLLG
jgi:hypothetical protein